MITVNNFGGAGFEALTCAHMRFTDVSATDEVQHKPLGWFRVASRPGADKDKTTSSWASCTGWVLPRMLVSLTGTASLVQ